MNREGSIYDALANELLHLTHFCESGYIRELNWVGDQLLNMLGRQLF